MTGVRRLVLALSGFILLFFAGCGRPTWPPNPPGKCYAECDGRDVVESGCVTDAVEVLSARIPAKDETHLKGVLTLYKGVDRGSDQREWCSNIYWSEFKPDSRNTVPYELATFVSGFKSTPSVGMTTPTATARTVGFFVGVNQRVNAYVFNTAVDILPPLRFGLKGAVGTM